MSDVWKLCKNTVDDGTIGVKDWVVVHVREHINRLNVRLLHCITS